MIQVIWVILIWKIKFSLFGELLWLKCLSQGKVRQCFNLLYTMTPLLSWFCEIYVGLPTWFSEVTQQNITDFNFFS